MKIVILAGGKGTRLWPVSRQEKPKQFQCLISGKTMLQETYMRMREIVDPDDIYIVTNKEYVLEVEKELLEFPKENILAEPVGRGTAPSVALAAAVISKKCGDETMGVFAADHFIKNPELLLKAIGQAEKFLSKSADCLITFGIKPSAPETGYGYIEKGRLLKELDGVAVYRAKRFVEKPNFETAKEYLKSGYFFWNSGMFLWKTSAIIEKFGRYAPDIYRRLVRINRAVGTRKFEKVLEKEFPQMDKISIDYAILENEPKILVIPLKLNWSDVGSWTALKNALTANGKENFVKGEHINFDSKNLLVYGTNKLIATIAVKNLIIVDTEDAILICDRNKSQLVSDVVKKLEETGKIQHL
ncbi:MAG: mannose-1-phosphate guanylyltransferase [Candidatus Moranbacteria bacterium]|nr:mannose-1-phosphate guanylyltransferase [Candidatus Moranbacteria bacterium]